MASSSVNTPSSDSSLLSNFHRNQLRSDNLPASDDGSKPSDPETTTTSTTAQLLQSTTSTKHCDKISVTTTTLSTTSSSSTVVKSSINKVLPRQRTLRTPIWARSMSNNKTY